MRAGRATTGIESRFCFSERAGTVPSGTVPQRNKPEPIQSYQDQKKRKDCARIWRFIRETGRKRTRRYPKAFPSGAASAWKMIRRIISIERPAGQKPSPLGVVRARKTVRWTVFTEQRAGRPRWWHAAGVTDEVHPGACRPLDMITELQQIPERREGSVQDACIIQRFIESSIKTAG